MPRLIKEFASDETGATAIEYAMMVMLIGLSGVLSFNLAGGNVYKLYVVIESGVRGMVK